MNATFEIDRDFYRHIYCAESEYSVCAPHFHSNIEVVYVWEGELEVTIGTTCQLLTAGCVSIANSYDIHSYKTPSYSKVTLLIIPTDLVKGFSALSQSSTFTRPFMQSCPQSGEIGHALQKLLPFHNTRDSITAKGYMYVILGTLIQVLGLCDRSVNSAPESLMRNILIFLEENYLEHLTIGDLAKQFGYNKDYLSRFFNASLGCGFNQYLNVLRARHAASLIQNTKNSLMEIAYSSGFGSSRTFTRAFKEFYQTTPLEYKQRNNLEKNSL